MPTTTWSIYENIRMADWDFQLNEHEWFLVTENQKDKQMLWQAIV